MIQCEAAGSGQWHRGGTDVAIMRGQLASYTHLRQQCP